MKKLLLILLCLPLLTLAQQTYVPDDNFESYLETHNALGIWVPFGDPTSMGNGIWSDDSVITSKINIATFLSIGFQNIFDLTGIEDFTSIISLSCGHNQLSILDISMHTNLTALDCSDNQLTNLDLSNNTALKWLYCFRNQINSLDLSNNTALINLWCNNNQLTTLLLDNNINLEELKCYNNQLISLDVRNGNNSAFTVFWVIQNPNLTCINVDDSTWSNNNWTVTNNNINSQHYFSNNCSEVTSIQEYTTNKELLKVTDLLGRETKQTNQPLFYIYDDGTVEKRIVIE